MSNHLGDTNKMVSETPRTDAGKKIVLGGVGGDWEVVHIAFSRQLERELNAANEMFRKLNIHTLNLVDRIKRLEEGGDKAGSEAGSVDSEEEADQEELVIPPPAPPPQELPVAGAGAE